MLGNNPPRCDTTLSPAMATAPEGAVMVPKPRAASNCCAWTIGAIADNTANAKSKLSFLKGLLRSIELGPRSISLAMRNSPTLKL